MLALFFRDVKERKEAALYNEIEKKAGKHNMKILMINHFPLAGSGSGTYTRNLAVHLSELGHEVCIILPENTNDYSEPEGVRLHPVFFSPKGDEARKSIPEEELGRTMDSALPFNFPCFTSHPRSVMTFGDLDEEKLRLYIKAFQNAIDEEIEKDRPDIVHGQHVWILPSLAVRKGIPLVLTAHGTDLMGFDKWPHLREYAQRAMDECFAVISISKDNCELIRERFPEDSDKIVMMRNGYDPKIFYPEDVDKAGLFERHGITKEEYEGRKIISFAGKLAHFKGVDVLLEAAKIYEDKKPQTITLIVGDGDERDVLHKQAKDLNLKTVHFFGNVDQRELRHVYNSADVNLVPSRREPFGLVAIEAMACGTPVIATNQGGLPDFVNDSVGGLVEPEDAKDLADKILEVLKRTDEDDVCKWRKQIADYARNHYAQDKIIEELDTLYKKAMKG